MKDTIDIRGYIDIFAKNKWIVLLIIMLSTVVGYGISYMKNKAYVPMYQAEARIRINTAKTIPDQGFSPAVTSLNQSIVSTYLDLAKSKSTMNEVIHKLGLDIQPEIISGKIVLIPDATNSEFVTIRAIDLDPNIAAQIANAVPQAFNNELKKTINLDCVVVIDKAVEPKYPIPQVKSNLTFKAATVGLVLSIFVVLLLEFLNNKIITPEDVEEYWGVQVIGIVPYSKTKKKDKKTVSKEVN